MSHGNSLEAMTARTERSDGDLIGAAAAGDRDAFATLYQRHHLGVYRFARTMSGSATAAEDVTQEVFLAFMQGLDRYDETRGSLRTYLYGTVRSRLHRARQMLAERMVGSGDRRPAVGERLRCAL